MDEIIPFIPVLDFISKNPLVEKVIWDSNLNRDPRIQGNVKEEEDPNLTSMQDNIKEEEDPAIENMDNIKEKEEEGPAIENIGTGDWVVDGFVRELFAAHGYGVSWAGNFDESDMLASTIGKFIKIAKIPTEKASIWNRLLDLWNLATRLFGLATAKENLLILRTSLIVLRR